MGSHHLRRRGVGSSIYTLMLLGLLAVMLAPYAGAYPGVALGKQETVGVQVCGEYATTYGQVISTSQEYASVVYFDYLINDTYYFGTDPGFIFVYFNFTDSGGSAMSSSGIVYPTISYHDIDFMDYNYTYTFSDVTFDEDGIYSLWVNCFLYYSDTGYTQAFPGMKVNLDVQREYVPTVELLNDWWGGMGALLMIFGVGFVVAFGKNVDTMKLLIISGSMILFGGIFVWTFWIGG